MFTTEKAPGEIHEQPYREWLPEEITKLSEAIRIGSKKRPQCTGDYFVEGRSCAIGAAWEAMGLLGKRKPSFSSTGTVSAMGFTVPDDIVIEAFNMNDSGKTREQVADWLESQGY